MNLGVESSFIGVPAKSNWGSTERSLDDSFSGAPLACSTLFLRIIGIHYPTMLELEERKQIRNPVLRIKDISFDRLFAYF